MDTDEMTELIYDMIPSIIEDATINWKAIVDEVDLDTFIKVSSCDYSEKSLNLSGVGSETKPPNMLQVQ